MFTLREVEPKVRLYRCKLCGALKYRSERRYHVNVEHGLRKPRKFWKFFEKV